MSDTPKPSPGWYTDKTKPGYERWWDGEAWSNRIRPKAGQPGGDDKKSKAKWAGRLVVYPILAFILVVAFIWVAQQRGWV